MRSKEKIPWRIKVTYALLATSVTMMATIGSNLSKYYTNFIGMSVSLFGYAQLAFAVVNSLNDPLIGYLIDKTPRSKGETKFTWYILLAIPFLVIGMVFQLLGQSNWPSVLLFLTVFLGYSIYDSGIAMYGISKGNIIIEGSSSDKERSSIESVSLIFQTFFGIAGFLLPAYFLTGNDATQIQALLMFIGFAVLGVIFYIFSALGFRKNTTSFIPKEEKRIVKNYGKTIKLMFRQKSYILYIFCAILIVGVQANSQIFMIYYLDNCLDLTNESITLISAVFFPVYLIVYIIGPTMVKKIGVKRFLTIGVILTLIGYTGVLIGLTGFLAFTALAFSSIGGLFWWIANLALFGKVFDEFESKHGKIDKGVFMGINGIFASPAPSVVFFLFSIIAEAFFFNDQLPKQTNLAKLGLRLGIGAVSIALNLIALILIFLMPNWKKDRSKKL